MANLFELCKSISPKIVRIQQQNVVRARMMASYQKRTSDLSAERNIFEKCKDARPMRRKFHNTLFKEQSGTIQEYISDKRVGDFCVVTCRTKNIY